MNDYWQKQGSEPLFPNISWSRPENKLHAGKLLIVGGHAHGFSAPAEAYTAALRAGIGTARVMLPDHIRPQLQKFHGISLETEFAPSTPSGSFASKSLAELLDAAAWADGLLLAGDLGRNSETAIVLEMLVAKTALPLIITKDAIDYFSTSPQVISKRHNICLVLTIAQLQKLATNLRHPEPVTFSMELLQLVEWLHVFTRAHQLYIVLKHHDNLFVAVKGQVSTTKTALGNEDAWRVATGARAAVWLIQNPNKPFQALTTSVLENV